MLPPCRGVDFLDGVSTPPRSVALRGDFDRSHLFEFFVATYNSTRGVRRGGITAPSVGNTDRPASAACPGGLFSLFWPRGRFLAHAAPPILPLLCQSNRVLGIKPASHSEDSSWRGASVCHCSHVLDAGSSQWQSQVGDAGSSQWQSQVGDTGLSASVSLQSCARYGLQSVAVSSWRYGPQCVTAVMCEILAAVSGSLKLEIRASVCHCSHVRDTGRSQWQSQVGDTDRSVSLQSCARYG